MPAISPDNLTWTIPIRPGVHYYDPEKRVFPDGKGPEITANDFIYAWKRVADFHQASQNYSAMFEDRIVGLDEWRKYTQQTPPDKIDWDRPVEGLKALDTYTLQIKLKRPDPQLRYNLAHLPTAPVSRDAANYWGDNLKHHPIGSGPYVLAEDLPEQRIVFTANPIYRGRAEDLPHIQRVQMDYFDEDLPAWALFQQGLLDVAGIPKDVFGQAINARTGSLTPEMEAKGIRLRREPMPAIYYFGFNMKDPVLGKNKPLRQAMSMAFDRQQYIELFLNGRGQPASGPIPPGFPTYDSKLVNPYTEFNLAGAKEKLVEAVKINGGPIPTIELLLPGTDTTFRQMGEFMKKQMAQIGIDIRVNYTTWARFQEMIDGKQAQFYALGWVADYPDEQTFLQLFWSKNETPGPNSANYVNPEFDKLYEQAMVMNPGPERDALYRKMQQIVMEDTPWMYNFYPVSYRLYYDWVQNTSNNEYAHGMTKFLVLDEKLRQERLSGHVKEGN
jgi:ABC-type transport system substrate-binding protein